ncbi:hypothetical protein PRUPE_1G072800 [Prunus persica]|uniref:Uncharacterized protein n=1 Tax=Prunus persica TaxID=3760 RepID=A0A251QTM9_PRUPE|nr:hypothetical protein PRUPE_1G072800 [Prunus persica]
MEYFLCFVFGLQGYGISRQGELQHREIHLDMFSMSRLRKTMPIKQYINDEHQDRTLETRQESGILFETK